MTDPYYDHLKGHREQMGFDLAPEDGPCNLEGEAALLGALMIDNRQIENVGGVITAGDFYHAAHQKFYQLICALSEEGITATPVTLKPLVERDPMLRRVFEKTGGPAHYLACLTGSGAGLIGTRQFAQQIAQLSILRQIKFEAASAVELAMTGEVSLTQATSGLDQALARALHQEKPAQPLDGAAMFRRVKDRSARLTETALAGAVGPQCATISDLNGLIGPLEPGMFVVAAGRPGMGKTTLACSAAWGYAANGHAVEYFAFEGSEDTLAMRFASDMSLDNGHPVPHDNIRKDKLSPEDRQHLDLLEERAQALPINFQVLPRIDVRRLRAYVAKAVAKWASRGRKLELVFVDYLQLLRATVRGQDVDDDRKRVSAVSNALLDIAKDFDLVVVALSQLSRAVEQRPDKRPQMSDLRESGKIEEDADVVLLLYREQHYLEHAKPREGIKNFKDELEDWEIRMARCRDRVDLILGKNRHGEARTRTAKFYGKYYAIRGGDYAPDYDSDPLLI